MKISPIKNEKTSFKSVYFENYNYKFDNIRSKLEKETERFFNNKNNVSKIGEGIGGETFRFTDSSLKNIVIKTTKSNYSDDYKQEFENLMAIPTEIVEGQEGVARVYDISSDKYALISTLVTGKPASITNKYNDAQLRSLFDKMFALDKAGIYHGDLNGKNILLNNSGNVNFIDYQWTQFVKTINFYDTEKIIKMLLPRTVFPENAQMFEMASLPYYIDKLWLSSTKEGFMKKYLQAKSNYHDERAKYIAKLEPNWYSVEKPYIQQSLREERAKAKVYRIPNDTVIKLELKKLQFLSDYRDAYSHVDANLPDRNIIPSSAAYLCAISAVQDFRREVARELKYCIDSDKYEYLKSLQTYGDYWYSNLKEYTSDTFDYVMRAILNKPNYNESKHRFYINDRNPRIISPNRDILKGVSSKYKTVFDSNFDVPSGMRYTIMDIYDSTAKEISNSLSYDKKSRHRVDKVQSISKKSKKYENDCRYLDLLNVSQVGVLKIREFCGYVRHNLSSYSALNTLEILLENTTTFTNKLFKDIFNGLKYEYSGNIKVKGYSEMRLFKGKI